jgi:hypothetical protein
LNCIIQNRPIGIITINRQFWIKFLDNSRLPRYDAACKNNIIVRAFVYIPSKPGRTFLKKIIIFTSIFTLYCSFSYGFDLSLGDSSSGESIKIKDGSLSINKPDGNASSPLNFNKLRLDTQANLHIHMGDKASLDIGNNKASLSYKTDKGMLTISTGSDSSSDAEADVTAQNLDAIVLDSSGDIDITDVKQKDLEVILTGSGSIHITGHVENLTATNSGSGDLNLEDLVCENAHIISKGAGTSNINVRRVLKAEVSGAGDILYRGNPSRVIPQQSGAGSIARFDKPQDD